MSLISFRVVYISFIVSTSIVLLDISLSYKCTFILFFKINL